MLLPAREEIISGLGQDISCQSNDVVRKLGVIACLPGIVVLHETVDNAAENIVELGDKGAARGDGIGRNPEVPVEQTVKSTGGILVDLLTEPHQCLVVEKRNSYIIISCLKNILDEVIGGLRRIEVNEISDALGYRGNTLEGVLNDNLNHRIDVIRAVVIRVGIRKPPDKLSEHNLDIQVDLDERVGNAETDAAVSCVLTDAADNNILDDSLVVCKELKERLDNRYIGAVASACALYRSNVDVFQIAGQIEQKAVTVDKVIDA